MVAVAVLGAFLFVLGIGVGMFSFLGSRSQPVAPSPGPGGEGTVLVPGERINVLFLGIDWGVNGNHGVRFDATRADTIVLASFDPDTYEVNILHLPRDTRVAIPGRDGFTKLSHAHAYGGPLLTMETVSQFLGVRIHYYVRADFAGFVEAVDVLGGVEIDVPQNMFYEDPAQDLYINLRAGRQLLDGEKALQFVRFRQYIDGDIGRIRAQQAFITAFIRKFYDLDMLWRIPTLVQTVAQHLSTNLDRNTMLQLAATAVKVRQDRIRMEMLPGEPRELREGGTVVSFWVSDPVKTQRLVDLMIHGIDYEANSRIRVEVLNGTSSPGATTELVEHLRKLGFVVINVGQADKQNYRYTEVIQYTGDEQSLNHVRRAVSAFTRTARLVKRSATERYADFTIIVGADITK
jgi:LCP family protein required for cell wall assembly